MRFIVAGAIGPRAYPESPSRAGGRVDLGPLRRCVTKRAAGGPISLRARVSRFSRGERQDDAEAESPAVQSALRDPEAVRRRSRKSRRRGRAGHREVVRRKVRDGLPLQVLRQRRVRNDGRSGGASQSRQLCLQLPNLPRRALAGPRGSLPLARRLPQEDRSADQRRLSHRRRRNRRTSSFATDPAWRTANRRIRNAPSPPLERSASRPAGSVFTCSTSSRTCCRHLRSSTFPPPSSRPCCAATSRAVSGRADDARKTDDLS
jgi:hypothetical protein